MWEPSTRGRRAQEFACTTSRASSWRDTRSGLCKSAPSQGKQVNQQNLKIIGPFQVAPGSSPESLPVLCSWTEHDPLELLANVRTCIQEAVRAATEKVGPVKVRGVGLTNQRETTIAWDAETGTPLYNAIVWLDNRTSAICQRMEQELGSKVHIPFSVADTHHLCHHP